MGTAVYATLTTRRDMTNRDVLALGACLHRILRSASIGSSSHQAPVSMAIVSDTTAAAERPSYLLEEESNEALNSELLIGTCGTGPERYKFLLINNGETPWARRTTTGSGQMEATL